MRIHAAQKDRLSIEQNLIALYLDGAKTDIVGEMIVSRSEVHFVQTRMLRRPALEIVGVKGEARAAIAVNNRTLVNMKAWNLRRDLRSGCSSGYMNIALNISGTRQVKSF